MENNISLVDHLVLVFSCPCYSGRAHPMLEKPGAQNIAAFENESKRRELTDHWKSIKKLFLKKKVTRDDAKKRQKWKLE